MKTLIASALSAVIVTSGWGQSAPPDSPPRIEIDSTGTKINAKGNANYVAWVQALAFKLKSEQPVSNVKVDYFENNPKINIDNYTGTVSEFKAYLNSINAFEVSSAPRGSDIYGTRWVYNLGDLSDGEVQSFVSGGMVTLRAHKASLPEVVDHIDLMLKPGYAISLDTGGVKHVTFEKTSESTDDVIRLAEAHFKKSISNLPPALRPGAMFDTWPVTFLSTRPISVAGDGVFTRPASSSGAENSTLVAYSNAFNAIFGAGTVTPIGNTLALKGDAKTLFLIKEAMAKWIDVPFGQVKLDIWVYQGSERKSAEEKLTTKMQTINRGISLARGYQNCLRRDLESFLEKNRIPVAPHENPPRVFKELHQLFNYFHLFDPTSNKPREVNLEDFNTERARKRSFVELLVYSALFDRKSFQSDLKNALDKGSAAKELGLAYSRFDSRAGELKALRTKQKMAGKDLTSEEKDELLFCERMHRLTQSLRKKSEFPFARYARLISYGSIETDSQTICDFLRAYKECTYNGPVDPKLLTVMASNGDQLLMNATEAITADLRSAVVDPLREWIDGVSSDDPRGRPGIVLTGSTSISVSSTRPAATANQSVGFMPFSSSAPLTETTIKGLTENLNGLEVISSQGLLAVLTEISKTTKSETTYTTIAPGLSMTARPSILPGARSARVELEFRQAFDIQDPRADWAPNSSGSGIRPGGPQDFVKTQAGITDVSIDFFDLFELSGFSNQHTGIGSPRWEIPLLSGLPILGGMFKGPRGTTATVHRGFVIVNATIVPRTLDIMQRFD